MKNASVKQAATTRSARLPCTTTLGSSGGRPTTCGRRRPRRRRPRRPRRLGVGLGHRGRSEQARRGRGSADHPVRRNRGLGALGLFHVAHDCFCSVPMPRRSWITPPRGNPQRDENQEAQAAEEDDQALGDRPGPAEGEAARVGLDPGLRDVGDDVALGLRGDRAVGEHRHGLGPGQHGLVDLGRRGRGERRRVLAVGQRAAGQAGELWHCAQLALNSCEPSAVFPVLGSTPAGRPGSRARRPARRCSRRCRGSLAR